MTLIEKIFGTNETMEEDKKDKVIEEREKLVTGKITKLGQGWGFVSSRDIPYTRIFFHWTALRQDTRNFTELTKGMFLEFKAVRYERDGWRALNIYVVDREMTEEEKNG